jgi:hypothetical protein
MSCCTNCFEILDGYAIDRIILRCSGRTRQLSMRYRACSNALEDVSVFTKLFWSYLRA